MNNRWRTQLEVRFREELPNGYWFNRKRYKRVYKFWMKSKRLGLTQLSHGDFHMSVVIASQKARIKELYMSDKQLQKHLLEVKNTRPIITNKRGAK